MIFVRKTPTEKCLTVTNRFLSKLANVERSYKKSIKKWDAGKKKVRGNHQELHVYMQNSEGWGIPCFFFPSLGPAFLWIFFYFNAFIMFVKTSAPPTNVPIELPRDEKMNTNKTFKILFL